MVISSKNNTLKNINWINAVKALCIIFVFLRHSENYYGLSLGNNIDNLFSTFYVNGFFLISGYLLFWKQLSTPKILENSSEYISGSGKTLFLNVFYRIIIPSTLFSIIEFLPSCLIQGRTIDVGFALYKTIGGGTYWFTSALAVAECLCLLMFISRKGNMWFYTIVCITFGAVGLVIVNQRILQNDIWAWKQGIIAVVFLALGGLYWRYEKAIDKMMRWCIVLPLLLAYVIMVIVYKDFCDPIISTLSIQPLGFVTSAMACLLLIWLCKKIPEVKWISFIGRNSIGFYFMSGALPISISLIVHKTTEGYHLWVLFTIWLVCLVVAYVAVEIINGWMPWLWDLRKMKRIDR